MALFGGKKKAPAKKAKKAGINWERVQVFSKPEQLGALLKGLREQQGSVQCRTDQTQSGLASGRPWHG